MVTPEASVPAVLAGHKKGGRDSDDHRLAWPPRFPSLRGWPGRLYAVGPRFPLY